LVVPYLEERTISGERRLGLVDNDGTFLLIGRSEAAELLELPRREQVERLDVAVRTRRLDLGDEERVPAQGDPERVPHEALKGPRLVPPGRE
jgi:hypothetical protein